MFKKNYNRKGFSMVEVMVALFITIIVMMTAVGIFSKSVYGLRNAKAVQKDLENAQYAMNLMAKTLRTSSVVSSSGSPIKNIRIYDHSQGKCIGYRIDTNSLEYAENTGVVTELGCVAYALTFADLTTGFVDGVFTVVPSSSATRGKVTVSLKICPESGCGGNPKDEVKIQTTVSLRDYGI